MSKATFRALVIISTLLAITAAAIDALLPDLIPPPLSKAYEDLPTPAMYENPIALSLFACWALAGLIGTVGLLFFKRWARSLSFYTTILGFILYPFLGPALTSALSNTLYEASLVTWGAVLAASYFSPLSEHFSVKVQS